jgi:hypothetical protein
MLRSLGCRAGRKQATFKGETGTFEKGNEMKKLLSAAAIASALIMPPCGTCSSPMRETLGAFLQK